ncbi:MAG: hypothetical protein EOP04_16520 [Proteobacteria bacterium]|nr:MAG: hypothetical protein EOP04_16520 [Pseudomonadota bacterium]
MAEIHKELMPNYRMDRERLLQDRSMVYWPQLINKPVLIVQGTSDQRVSLKHAEAAFAKLDQHHKSYKKLIYPGGDHGLDDFTDDLRLQISNWIKAYSK